MPQVVYTQQALTDLERLRNFLLIVAPKKVGEAIDLIFDKLDVLERTPLLGTLESHPTFPGLRKFVIPYGKNGYIAIYKYDEKTDTVLIETIRHMRELEADFLRNK